MTSATWPLVDYHSHVCYEPLEAMLAQARAAGLREYGVSEHIYQLDEGHLIMPDEPDEGNRYACAWYLETVRDAQSSSADLAVKLGLEVDYLPDLHANLLTVTDDIPWDYLIGSVHMVDGVDIFRNGGFSVEEGQRLWRRYYELLAEAIETGDFDVISHPVRFTVTNPHVPPKLDQLLDELAAFARLHGVALELNGDDMGRSPELVERLARACGRAGCVVSLGSDAHRPHTVAQGLERAAGFAAAAGVPGVVSFQRRDRRIIPF